MKKIIAIPIIFFISFLGVIYFLLPEIAEFQKFKERVSEKEGLVQEKEKEFLNLQKITTQLEFYQENLEKINTALPKEISLANLLNFFQDKASSSGLIVKGITQITPLQPKEKKKKEEKVKTRLKPHYFNLNLIGSLASFEEFLRNLETSARFFEVENISIENISKKESKEVLLEFNLTVKVYSYQ